MATTIARMTKKKLQDIVETALEQKLLEMLGDPDEVCGSDPEFAIVCSGSRRWLRQVNAARP